MHLSRFNGFHKQHKFSRIRYSARAIKLISALRIQMIPMHPVKLQRMADHLNFGGGSIFRCGSVTTTFALVLRDIQMDTIY
jgi:hypothetical protein